MIFRISFFPIPPELYINNSELLIILEKTIEIEIKKEIDANIGKSEKAFKKIIIRISEVTKGVSMLSLITRKN